MISTMKLTSMVRNWQRLARASRRKISIPRIGSPRRGSSEVEKGCFVVYTTDELRFALPLAFLQSEIIQELLRLAEEKFGLARSGPITVPCDSICLNYAISMIQQRVDTEIAEAAILCLSSCHQLSLSPSSPSLYLNHKHLALSCC